MVMGAAALGAYLSAAAAIAEAAISKRNGKQRAKATERVENVCSICNTAAWRCRRHAAAKLCMAGHGKT
jgi:hypothetical protein